MANALYPLWVAGLLQGSSNMTLNGTVKAALIDTNDVSYSAAHDFYNDISAGVVGTPQTLGSKTYTGGVFDAADVTFTGLTGDQLEAIVIYIDTGNPATSPLVAWIDTGITNSPLTPTGADVTIVWNASGIFEIKLP